MEKEQVAALLGDLVQAIKAQQEINGIVQKDLESLHKAVLQLADLVGKAVSVGM